ncbi:GHKL domain-containing protein [bacterium]|nr:GHKL domain-containing protein [bacterium]
MEENSEKQKENNTFSIDSSVDGVTDLFRMKLYIYLLVGGIIYSAFLFFTRAVALGMSNIGFYLHLIFLLSVIAFYIIALITKKHMPHVAWLLSILMVLATGLFVTSDLGLLSPVYQFYNALMVVSMFLVGFKYCTALYIGINIMYFSTWARLPEMLGIQFNEGMYMGDFYFYFSRIGSLTFIYFSLVFFHKLKISQHEMIIQMAKIYRDNEKHSVSKQIISGFAHEINNPLAIIDASIDQLARDPSRQKNIGKIKKSVLRVSTILKTLLESVEDRFESDYELNVSELVQKTLKDLSLSKKSENIRVRSHIESKLFAKVSEDSLYKVVYEILKNAKEAANDAGEKTEITLSFNEHPDGYVFECTDTANLLKKESIEKCSTLFYTTKNDRPGRGIGLYMVSSICQKLDWDFGLTLSKGLTRAKVLIPAKYIHLHRDEPGKEQWKA